MKDTLAITCYKATESSIMLQQEVKCGIETLPEAIKRNIGKMVALSMSEALIGILNVTEDATNDYFGTVTTTIHLSCQVLLI